VTLVSVGEREVLVRLADGRTGVIDRADFDDADLGSPAEGSDLAAAVLQREYPDGRVPMSAKWAARTLGWARVTSALETGEVLNGTVERSIKGGFVVRVGLPAFMPQSLVGDVEGNASELVGTEVEVVVKEVDRFADRVVVSRRDPQRRAYRAAEREQYAALSPGQRHSGEVIEVLDGGAKVRISGLVGLVHRSELSWARVGHPRDVVSVGDAVEVEVLEVVRSKRRIKLSIKRTTPHPFDSVTVGDTYPAVIQRVLEYGAIAEIGDTGAVGLIHRNELSGVPGQRPDQLVVPGEEIQVKVLSVDPEKDRMALSAVQATYL
jgi:ribosomal protein S1